MPLLSIKLAFDCEALDDELPSGEAIFVPCVHVLCEPCDVWYGGAVSNCPTCPDTVLCCPTCSAPHRRPCPYDCTTCLGEICGGAGCGTPRSRR